MKKFLALTAVAAMALPMSATAEQRIEVGKTYICSVEAIRSNTSICANVTLPSPASDLCVRIETADRYVTSDVVLNDRGEGACLVPASYGTGTSGATTTTAGLGGLAGAGPAIAVLVSVAAIAAASGGGNSNGTN
jgi:hypothetical protein